MRINGREVQRTWQEKLATNTIRREQVMVQENQGKAHTTTGNPVDKDPGRMIVVSPCFPEGVTLQGIAMGGAVLIIGPAQDRQTLNLTGNAMMCHPVH